MQFNIGDRVRVVNGESGYGGGTGLITGVLRIPADVPSKPKAQFRGYAVQLDGGQIEVFFGLDLAVESRAE